MPRSAAASSMGQRHGAAGLLLARRGNYFNGDRKRLTVGNTEVVAGIISQLIGCKRPARHRQPPASIERYDTVLLGSPIWNVRAPMIMKTFVEGFDFTGTTVHPLTDAQPAVEAWLRRIGLLTR